MKYPVHGSIADLATCKHFRFVELKQTDESGISIVNLELDSYLKDLVILKETWDVVQNRGKYYPNQYLPSSTQMAPSGSLERMTDVNVPVEIENDLHSGILIVSAPD